MPEFDWEQAYARLDRARQALAAAVDRPRDEVQRLLAARAQALARPREEVQVPAEALDLLVFLLGGERYAIETSHVLEAVPLRALTPVPCTPPFVLGVVNYRGQILPVLDLRRLFELAEVAVPEESRVVAVEAGGMRFGIFADAIEGTIRVPTQELAPPPAAVTVDRQAFIRGVTPELIAVLDLQGLAKDRRIVVNEEVADL
jgi:purine-binding chemotaxis protein CheW